MMTRCLDAWLLSPTLVYHNSRNCWEGEQVTNLISLNHIDGHSLSTLPRRSYSCVQGMFIYPQISEPIGKAGRAAAKGRNDEGHQKSYTRTYSGRLLRVIYLHYHLVINIGIILLWLQRREDALVFRLPTEVTTYLQTQEIVDDLKKISSNDWARIRHGAG